MGDSITAEELASMQDRGEAFTLVDTRPEESFEAWHVSGAENFPFGPDESMDDERYAEFARFRERVDGTEPLVSICAKGISSRTLADELEQRGHDISVVEGGMEAWSEVYEVAPVETTDDRLEILQVQRRAKGCLGYVVGSTGEEVAAAVDVTRHTDEFERAAREAGYDITHVLDTHVHADHLSGGRALADELGVPYYLGAGADARDLAYEYEPLDRNEVLRVGDVEVKAVHTPGHTSEMVSYLVNAEAVLTGDALFVDSVGRTELEFGDESAAEGARMQFESLHASLMSEPDSVTVLPGHVDITDDGEYASAAPGKSVTSTIGTLRRDLDLLGLDETAFVERLTASIPEKPPNYETVIALNRGVTELDDEQEATELELGPNSCAAG